MSVETIASLLLSLGILGLWYVSRILQGSWIGPGGALCCIWFFGSFLPLLVSGYYPSNVHGYLLVFLFVLVGVATSSIPMMLWKQPKYEGFKWNDGQLILLNRLYWCFLLCGFIASALLYRAAAGQFNSADLLSLANEVTVARYKGDFNAPLIVTLLNAVLYACTMLGGFLLGCKPGHTGLERCKYLLWILPLMAATVIQTTKASFLFGAVMWASGLVVGTVLRGGERSIRFGRLLLGIITVCAVTFTFLFLMQFVRWGSFDMKQASEGVAKTTVTFLGHMGVFSKWVEDDGIWRSSMSGGSYTFGGITELMGLNERKMGVYEESVYFEDGQMSNIYTAFRSLIEDFTFPGAIVAFGVASFFSGIFWMGLLRRRMWAAALYICYVGYAFISPVTSVFVYNTNVAAFALFGASIIGVAALRQPLQIRQAGRYARSS